MAIQTSMRNGCDPPLDLPPVLKRASTVTFDPEEFEKVKDELERRAWENLREIRGVLKDTAGIELEPPAKKTSDLEGRIVKEAVRRVIMDRQIALAELVHAVSEYRRVAESKPLTLQGSEYAHAVLELNNAIDRVEGFLQT